MELLQFDIPIEINFNVVVWSIRIHFFFFIFSFFVRLVSFALSICSNFVSHFGNLSCFVCFAISFSFQQMRAFHQFKPFWVFLFQFAKQKCSVSIYRYYNTFFFLSFFLSLFYSFISIQGKDLPAKDLSGTSDPYVRVTLLPDKKHRLETKIKRRTLNPRWNETFYFEGFPIQKLNTRVLHLHVFDYDRFSRDDSIGEVFLPLCQVSSFIQLNLFKMICVLAE